MLTLPLGNKCQELKSVILFTSLFSLLDVVVNDGLGSLRIPDHHLRWSSLIAVMTSMVMVMMMMMVLMRRMTLGWAETFQEFAFDISGIVELGWDLVWSQFISS